jgi:hypothetical protein
MYEAIARWEAKGRKRWLELYRDETRDGKLAFFYRGEGCGGNMGYMPSDAAGIAGALRPATSA